MKTPKPQPAVADVPLIEPAIIKLSMDETRAVMRVAVAGKPIAGDYHFASLAEMGILRRIEVAEEKDTGQKLAACWQRARKALGLKDSQGLHQAMHDLERLSTDRDRNEKKFLFELTDLGIQVARGISIRLNRQYRKT